MYVYQWICFSFHFLSDRHEACQLECAQWKAHCTAQVRWCSPILSVGYVGGGQILSVLRYVKAIDKVGTVSARQFLEAAANEGDSILFYTVYKFF